MRGIFLAGLTASIGFGISVIAFTGSCPRPVAEKTLEGVVAGTYYYCMDASPGGESGCADCNMDESGDWVRCSSENSQLTECAMPYVGPPPSPTCEDWTYDCKGTVWKYASEFDCQLDIDREETIACARTYVTVKGTNTAQGVNCP